MTRPDVTALERRLARLCELCPVCRHARSRQQGIAFTIVKSVEIAVCPFCQAYEKVHGKKSHEKP